MKNNTTPTDSIPDELRPEFMFQTISTKLLSDAATGKINLKKLAITELRNRGLNNNGEWVGFKS